MICQVCSYNNYIMCQCSIQKNFVKIFRNRISQFFSSLSHLVARLTVTPLRQSTVYHTIHIVTNTVVMGKNTIIIAAVACLLLLLLLYRYSPHPPADLPQLESSDYYGHSY